MPVKIHIEKDTPEDRIAAVRLTIKNGEGLTMREVAALIGRSENRAKEICMNRGWSIRQYSVEKRNYLNLLVNPKTLALCRKK